MNDVYSGKSNPLRNGGGTAHVPEPCTVVIFGASGDLTKRKTVPALYSLARERLLPPSVAIVGFARKPLVDSFREKMREGCDAFARRRPVDEGLWRDFGSGIHYHEGAFDDLDAYVRLKNRLAEIERNRGLVGNRVYYLSTPPSSFPVILRNLRASGLLIAGADRPFGRVIIEKPFGVNLESAQLLNRQVTEVAPEGQIYRIDHYLGKETVQNMLLFRFANGIFEPMWNNRFIDQVQITGAEEIGIEGRGRYYEEAGILRDMVQNHLFQVLCLTAMEPPGSFNADAIRDEKVKVLEALRPVGETGPDKSVVRAQYSAGSIQGRLLSGYKSEPGVSATSTSETYVALKMFVDNWRWSGVPFYLRSGKAMPKRMTEVALFFKAAPHRLFGSADASSVVANVLAIRIQPDEGISLKFGCKVPGPTNELRPVHMDFRYGTSFGVEPPEAYERLILDCMLGDATLFIRGDEAEASWRFITPIHEAWAAARPRSLPTYEAGTWGPAESDAMLAASGHAWRLP
jgi:glucose-6-phosphate 1-dehydrogenase